MSQTKAQEIPIRKVVLNHLSELPNDYSSTPGGTIFSTTPGGTRIIYDRSFLLKCRSSPLSNTPPSNLPNIPGVTIPDTTSNKIDGKIAEEPTMTIGKEGGGKLQQTGMLSSQFVAPGYGYEVYASAKSPLQQYRQRNFVQQNPVYYDKPCQEVSEGGPSSSFLTRGAGIIPTNPCNQFIALPQPTCINAANAFVGDGSWQETYDMVSVSALRKTCPTSQLSLWRQNKLNQSNQSPVPNVTVNTAAQMPPSNAFPPGHPGLSLYRNVGRSYSQGMWPESLCDPLEKLFKLHTGSGFVPGQTVPYANYTPAYGQYDYSREVGMQYDSASIMQ